MTDVLINKLKNRTSSRDLVDNKVGGDVIDTIGMNKRDYLRMKRMQGLTDSHSADNLPGINPK